VAWRYLAQRLSDGVWLDTDLPLGGVQITDTLSGPGGLSATITPEVARLKTSDGSPLLVEWSTAVYAEADGQIRSGAILTSSAFGAAGQWKLDCTGFAGYPQGMPYGGDVSFVDADPLDIARHIWVHLQSQPGGDLGVQVDATVSPVRVGEPVRDVAFTTGAGVAVGFQAGPRKLNWWSTDDLGKELDNLARETPFDYHEEHRWNGERVEHFLRLGYPRLGRRRTDLRFVVGENIAVLPEPTRDGAGFANTVVSLGSGEGRDMVRGADVSVADGRVRRVAVVADKALRDPAQLTAVGRRELGVRQGLLDVTRVVVRDHPNAPVGAVAVGDEIRVVGELGWVDMDLWFRVVAATITPEAADTAAYTVVRSDKAAL
jgi:hypothetical protein